MKFLKRCPSLQINSAHARNLRKSLDLNLNTTQTIVANIYECNSWQELKLRCNQKYDSSSLQLPMYYLEAHEIERFKYLVDKYQDELEVEFLFKDYLPSSLLSQILRRDFGAIEHYQIECILNSYAEYEDNYYSFKRSLGWGEQSAKKVIDSLMSWESARRPVSIWLRTATYQQNIYLNCKFNDIEDDSDKVVFIAVEEWFTSIQTPNPDASICNADWFVKYMIGYIEILAQQFIDLGYQPAFKFTKLQNVYLSSLTSAYENESHPQHGIYKLARSLIEHGKSLNKNMKYNEVISKRGINLSFVKKSQCYFTR